MGGTLSTGEEGVCLCGGEGMRWGAHCQLVRMVCVCVWWGGNEVGDRERGEVPEEAVRGNGMKAETSLCDV